MTQEKKETFRDKMDRFWAVLFLTEEGRPKSALMLYSFCLSLVFFGVYAFAYGFLLDVLEKLLSAYSITVRNVFQSVVPGLAGSVVCCSLFFLFKDRRLIPATYIWLTLYALVALIGMLLITAGEESRIFLYFYAMLVPTGLISGDAAMFLLYRRYRRKQEEAKAQC